MSHKKKDLIDTYTMLDPKVSDVTTYIDRSYMYQFTAPHPPSYTTIVPGSGDKYVYHPAVTWPSTTLTGYDWTKYPDIIDKIAPEYKEVNTVSSEEKTPEGTAHMIVCKDKDNLSEKNILKNLSAIKGKLMLDVAPIRVKYIECYMTPIVKHNIIMASKKLRMYGKKLPIIPRFDDYGRKLPDEITIDTAEGMVLHIVNPEDFGEYYFALRAIEFPTAYTINDFSALDVYDMNTYL